MKDDIKKSKDKGNEKFFLLLKIGSFYLLTSPPHLSIEIEDTLIIMYKWASIHLTLVFINTVFSCLVEYQLEEQSR